MRGALSKYCWNFSASSVADMTTSFRSLRLNIIYSKAGETCYNRIVSILPIMCIPDSDVVGVRHNKEGSFERIPSRTYILKQPHKYVSRKRSFVRFVQDDAAVSREW